MCAAIVGGTEILNACMVHETLQSSGLIVQGLPWQIEVNRSLEKSVHQILSSQTLNFWPTHILCIARLSMKSYLLGILDGESCPPPGCIFVDS